MVSRIGRGLCIGALPGLLWALGMGLAGCGEFKRPFEDEAMVTAAGDGGEAEPGAGGGKAPGARDSVVVDPVGQLDAGPPKKPSSGKGPQGGEGVEGAGGEVPGEGGEGQEGGGDPPEGGEGVEGGEGSEGSEGGAAGEGAEGQETLPVLELDAGAGPGVDEWDAAVGEVSGDPEPPEFRVLNLDGAAQVRIKPLAALRSYRVLVDGEAAAGAELFDGSKGGALYIDVPELDNGTTYEISVMTLTSMSRSPPSAPQAVTPLYDDVVALGNREANPENALVLTTSGFAVGDWNSDLTRSTLALEVGGDGEPNFVKGLQAQTVEIVQVAAASMTDPYFMFTSAPETGYAPVARDDTPVPLREGLYFLRVTLAPEFTGATHYLALHIQTLKQEGKDVTIRARVRFQPAAGNRDI